jgi:hypothetical protein
VDHEGFVALQVRFNGCATVTISKDNPDEIRTDLMALGLSREEANRILDDAGQRRRNSRTTSRVLRPSPLPSTVPSVATVFAVPSVRARTVRSGLALPRTRTVTSFGRRRRAARSGTTTRVSKR